LLVTQKLILHKLQRSEKWIAHSTSSSDVHDTEDESLTIRKKEMSTEEETGFGSGFRKWFNRTAGTSEQPEFSVPDHWKTEIRKSRDGHKLEKYYGNVAKINSLEPECREMTDDELKAKTDLFRKRLAEGEPLESVLVEAFAIVRETSRRVLGMRHYDCQLVGGMILNDGQIAEMETGEGKTLVATLPVYLNACAGKTVHIITVNEYLAERDAEWMGRIYKFLGLTVAAIKSSMDIEELKEAHSKQVIYVTGQKLCFDYLHDWTANSVSSMVMSPLDFGIVDEVDSILIDESRIPMVLSGPSERTTDKIKISAEILYELLEVQNYRLVNSFGNTLRRLEVLAKQLSSTKVPASDVYVVQIAIDDLIKLIEKKLIPTAMAPREFLLELPQIRDSKLLNVPEHFRGVLKMLLQYQPLLKHEMLYTVKHHSQSATITDFGAELLKRMLEHRGEKLRGDAGVSLWESSDQSEPWGPYLMNAIKAYEFFKLGKQYIVVNARIVIVDESTGRTRDTSRWQQALHQAVEAKEQVYQEKKFARDGVNMDKPIEIKSEDQTIASITFQVFFRYYPKLAGMSGTAMSEEAEFFETYGLSVVHVPTHRPSQREDYPPVIFLQKSAKRMCLLNQLLQCKGIRPVLIGTNSVEESEELIQFLRQDHGNRANPLWNGQKRYEQGRILMLNARPEVVKTESHIIAQAGLPGMITVATRMAGRGTDILLGGNSKLIIWINPQPCRFLILI